VFDRGRIQQVGTPQEIYERPVSQFVAGFVGTSNLVSGAPARALLGEDGTFTVRPEHLLVDGSGDVEAAGTVAEVVYAGPVTRYLVDLEAGTRLSTVVQNHGRDAGRLARGDRVTLAFDRRHVRRLADDHDSGQAPPTRKG
jgi:putative spermidine/putrescine transport system ATP-binding protein